MNTSDTIAAIATPIGSGGIGVIRISGSESLAIASQVFKPDPRSFLTHTAHHGAVVHPRSGEEIDDAVLTVFRGPRSYTGDDVVELSCHGGIATVRTALAAVLEAGARLAEPGEFTQRAFLNGRIDLAQAEAVNDLIRARTDEARKVALRQLDGKLSGKISGVSSKILGVIAAVEAAIDFPEDVPEPEPEWIIGEIGAARSVVEDLLNTFGRGRIYREGLRVVIAGRVNVGKSSLLNALLRHARAIVTPIPGTTRDVIEESLEIRGIPIVAIDTAGLRATDDPVEQIGVELSHRSIESADIVLLVIDASKGMHEEDRAMLERLRGRQVIVAANKIDLADGYHAEDESIILTSAPSGEGIEALEDRIAEIAGSEPMGSEGIVVSNIRHERSLRSAYESLGQAIVTLGNAEPIDLLSGDLMAARNALGLITGETASEDLLDRIFSEFCIGK